MSNILRKMNSTIDVNRIVNVTYNSDFAKSLDLRIVRKTLGGRNNAQTLKKAIELYAYNNVDISKSLVEQMKYDSSKISIFNEISNEKDITLLNHTDKLKYEIRLEYWKIAVCINSISNAFSIEDYLLEIIDWSSKFSKKLSGEI